MPSSVPPSTPDATDLAPSPGPASSPKKWDPSTPHIWVSSTNFSEGYFYGVVHTLAEMLFAALGASLGAIGLTSLFHLPWNLKFTWGPILDRYETKRRFLVATQLLLVVLIFGLAASVGLDAPLEWLALVFVAMAVVAATQDIAIDGFYLEALDKNAAARFVGYRATAFKVATLLLGGPVLTMIAVVSWPLGLAACGFVGLLLVSYHARYLPHPETRRIPLQQGLKHLRTPVWGLGLALLVGLGVVEWQTGAVSSHWERFGSWRRGLPVVGKISGSEWVVLALFSALLIGVALLGRARAILQRRQGPIAQAYLSFLEQPHFGRALAFVVLFRLGESLVSKMRWPFLKQECAYDLVQYSLVNGSFGVAATMVATLLGGWLISRDGLRRWLLPAMIAQNSLNWLFFALAMAPNPATQPRWWIATVLTVDNFASGLGTAAFLVYMMRCCHPDHKAGHMAIVTSVMSVGWTVAGVASGVLAERLGFAAYFALSFFVTLPSMLLVKFIPHLEPRRPSPEVNRRTP